MQRDSGSLLATLLPALTAGFLLCILLAAAAGVGPLELARTIWTGSWGSAGAAANTMTKATPLLLTGLAVALAYRAGLLNVGCEGQLTLGALAFAATARIPAPIPALLLLPLSFIAAAAAGGLWAYPAALLRRRRGVHEVITTLLLNYVAIYLCGYLVEGPLGDGSGMGRTPPIPSGAEMPVLLHSGAIHLGSGPLIAILACLAAQLWLTRTVWGFEARSVGTSMEAALNAGVAAEKLQRRIFIVSGALAGLAGAIEVAAVHHRFYRSFSPGYGFDGLTAAFLANGSPIGLLLSGFFMASLRASDKWLQVELNLSPNFIWIVQAILLLSVACRHAAGPVLKKTLTGIRIGKPG